MDGDDDIILCTIVDLEEELEDSIDIALVDRLYKEEGNKILNNDTRKSVRFYFKVP